MTTNTLLSPGSQVTQVSSGPIVPAAIATAIGGFLVYTQRGPVGVPIQVVSPDDAGEVYGGRITSPGYSRLADSLIDFFAEGGQTCYVMRFIGEDSQVGSRTLYTVGLTSGAERSNAGSFPVTDFDPGDTFYGVVDGGGAGTPLSGTVHVINGSPDVTFSAAQTIAKGTPVVFAEQPGVVYFISANVAASTAGVLTTNYTGTTAAATTTDTLVGFTATIEATPAQYTGTAGTFAAVTAGHTLTVRVNGVLGNQVITFNGTESDIAEFLATITAQLRGATVANATGEVMFSTNVAGSAAGGAIVSGSADVLASLGLAPAAWTNAGPNNVANLDAGVTAAEFAAIFNSEATGSTTTVNGDNSVTWTSDTIGAASSVEIGFGTGVSKVAGFLADTVFSGSGAFPLPTILLTAANGQYADPGTWSNSWSSLVTEQNTFVTSPAPTAPGVVTQLSVASSARLRIGDTFSITDGASVVRATINGINGNVLSLVDSITVPGEGYTGTEQLILETFSLQIIDDTGSNVFPGPYTNLRMSPLAGPNYFVNAINSMARTPVNAADLTAGNSDPRPLTDPAPVLFAGGLDGSAPVANDVISQIQNWNQAQDVNEVSIPGVADDFPGADGVGILTALQAYLALRADVMGIIDEPEETPSIGPGGPRDWIQNTANLASSYLACYWPWVQRLDVVSGALTSFPMSPHVQGCIARAQAAGNFATPPAGLVNGQLLNVQGLRTYVAEGGPEYNDAYPAGVNFALKFPGAGFAIWGSRTLDTSGDGFGQIGTQIVFNINKRLVKQSTRFVNFSFNDQSTRNAVVRVLTALFRQQRTAGILAGAKDSDAFFIVCDETNNTPLVIAQGLLVCRIGLAVQVPVEFQEYTLELNTAALSAQLATQAAAG
jgi:hypothetical protein